MQLNISEYEGHTHISDIKTNSYLGNMKEECYPKILYN